MTDEAQTIHYPGCWRQPSHSQCLIAEYNKARQAVKLLQFRLDEAGRLQERTGEERDAALAQVADLRRQLARLQAGTGGD
jgi:hypothetical protein